MSTDVEWEKWGQKDPYFGVITNEKFRSHKLTKEARIEFFQSGKSHVNHILQVCRRHLDQGFSPKRVLDFGCGVGRLVIPLAGVAEQVVGLDVSESMLNEARRNCDEYSLQNVSLLRSDDDLSPLSGSFDLVHSVIVFQHIPIERGRRIFTNLLSYLEAGGICAVQITYSKITFEKSYGLPPAERRPTLHEKLKRRLKNLMGIIKRRYRSPAIIDSHSRDPELLMNPYNINELYFQIQAAGVNNMYVEFTDHGGELGVFLYFQKPREA